MQDPPARRNSLQVALSLMNVEIKASIDRLTSVRTDGGTYFTTQNLHKMRNSHARAHEKEHYGPITFMRTKKSARVRMLSLGRQTAPLPCPDLHDLFV